MFPPPIPLKECPYCLRRVDARAGYCPICGEKIVERRDAAYWIRRFAGALMAIGLTAVIFTGLYITLIGDSSLALICGAPGLLLFIAGMLVRYKVT